PAALRSRMLSILLADGASFPAPPAGLVSAAIWVWPWNRASWPAHPHNSLPGLTRGAEISRSTWRNMSPVNGRNSRPARTPAASATHHALHAARPSLTALMDSPSSHGLNSTEAQLISVSPDLI